MFGRALLASGLLAVFAASFPTEHVPLSSSPAAPPGPWRAVDGAVDASHEMVFLVALPHRNAHELESTFWEVSDPNHERYGRHLSRDEVADAFGPAEEHKAAVAFWLASAGLSFEPTAAGDWFVVRAPAAAVEALFATQLARFEHQATGRRVVRAALPLLVPSFVAPAIDLIHGVADFPDPRASFSLSVGHAPPRGAAERAATLLRRAAHPSLPEPEAQFMGQGNHELVLSVVPYCAGPKGVEACPDMAALRGNITAFSARVVFAGNGSLVTESEVRRAWGAGASPSMRAALSACRPCPSRTPTPTPVPPVRAVLQRLLRRRPVPAGGVGAHQLCLLQRERGLQVQGRGRVVALR